MNGTAVTRFDGDERNIGQPCANLSSEVVDTSRALERLRFAAKPRATYLCWCSATIRVQLEPVALVESCNETLERDMAQQKTNPKLEQALTRGDLAIRQANSGRATAVLRALGKMIVEASATIGVEAHVVIHDGDKIYDPADGVWPQQLLVSLDGPVEENDPDEIRTITLLADTPATIFRCEWQRADGNIGRQEGRPLAMVAFITDVDIPWLDEDD